MGEQNDWVLAEDHETFEGRTSYAEHCAGGYYATRLGILEYLIRIRRQAEAIAFREVGEDYYVPLGVWEVRENVRNSFKMNIYKGNDDREAMEALYQELRVPRGLLAQKCFLLSRRVRQKRLHQFI
jgi:hypothetical protein